MANVRISQLPSPQTSITGSELIPLVQNGQTVQTSIRNAFSNVGLSSVGLTAPAIFTVTNSPLTSSGTIALTYSGTALPIANGGTGLTAVGANGSVLTSNGSSASWNSLTTVAVTSFSAGTTGLTPATATSGAVSLAGTLGIANGGTNATDAGTARTNLSAARSGTNTDITSIALTTGTISTAPSANTDIVNKLYADSIGSGVNFHSACIYATTANLGTVTYNNGTSGVGATITNAGVQAALAIDGYTFTSTDATNATRVLVKNQTAAAQNGVYTVTNQGSGSTNWVLTRATDYDTSGVGTNEIDQGDFVLIISGAVNSNTSWVQQTPLPIVVGTTSITFVQFGGAALPTPYTTNGILYATSTSALATGSALTFNGTNLTTTGSATATRFIPTGTTVPTNGMYLVSGGTGGVLGFASNTTRIMTISGYGSGFNGGVSIGSSLASTGSLLEVNINSMNGYNAGSPTATNALGIYNSGGTWAPGYNVITNVNINSLRSVTIDLFDGTDTGSVTTATTLYIEGAPVGSGNGAGTTITNPYALYIAAGTSYFGGSVTLASGGSFSGTITGTPTFSGAVVLSGTGAVTTSGGTLTANYTAGNKLVVSGAVSRTAWTTTGPAISVATATYTSSAGLTGTVTASSFAVPTFAATTASQTASIAATVYIAGNPTAGTNLTITDSYALMTEFNAGDFYLGGTRLRVSGNNSALLGAGNFGTALGVGLGVNAATYRSAAGMSGNVAANTFGRPTFQATTTSQTVTNAYTLYIDNAPANGTNVSITNPYAFYVNAGASFFGGDVIGGAATLNLFNTTATTVNFAGAGTTIGIGATTGTLTLNNPTVVGSQATVNLFNTVSTTVNFAGAGTSIAIGANTGTLTLNNPTVVGTTTTATLFNVTATTVNFAGAATTMLIGSATTTNFTIGGGTAAASTINLFAGPTTAVINLGTALTTASINVGIAQTTGNLVLGNIASTTGQIQLKSNLAFYQPAPPTTITATGSLLVASMKLRIIQVTSASAVTLTVDTGTNIDAAFSGMAVDTAFEFTIINTGSSAGAVTMAVATGVTFIGSLTIAISTSGTYRARKTAANTFVMYRVA